jgi:hypothetical protein
MAELTSPPDAEEFVAQHYGSRASQLELGSAPASGREPIPSNSTTRNQ